jgi:hypothetical protein
MAARSTTAGTPGEVLQEHACGREPDLSLGLGCRVPAGDGGRMLRQDVASVLVAQDVLEQDAEAVGQAFGARDRVDAMDVERAPTDRQGRPAPVAVHVLLLFLGASGCVRGASGVLPGFVRRGPLTLADRR